VRGLPSLEQLRIISRPWRFLAAAAIALLTAVTSAKAGELVGHVKDSSGARLVGARVVVLTAQRAILATATTDPSGQFAVAGLPDGQYLIVAQYRAFSDRQASVTLSGTGPVVVDLVLDVGPVRQDVTITATPGLLGDQSKVIQPVNVISESEILERVKTVMAQAVDGEAGVSLQRTSPGMAGIFVRGLTGNKVNVFVDGVRYSNGAQRGGVNTFLDLIDPSTVEGMEILRGPSSAQYGSDALGGSVQFLTRATPLADVGRPRIGGEVMFGGETGHLGGVGALSLAYSRSRLAISGDLSARKTGDYRPGGGVDSHAATTRFLGLPSDRFLSDRMPDTGFRQTAGHVRMNWSQSPDMLIVANYLSTRQNDANRWDQLLGGDGNLIAELNDLELDLFYLRLERLKAGWFDRFSATYSFNTQREERVNQGGNGNPNATIGHEPERTSVNGIQFIASRSLSTRQSMNVGGDAYFESLESKAFDVNPVTGAVTPRRPRVPDGAAYHQGGFFAQTRLAAVENRLALTGAVRIGFNQYAAYAADAPIVNGQPLWPDDSLDTISTTFQAGAAYAPASEWTLTAALSRGYRAPHMTDLGTLGLTGSGFEVAAPDVEGRGGFVGTTADLTARSTGRPVAQVGSETSLNLDLGVRYRTTNVRAAVGGFINKIDGNIQKQSLILPPGAVGTTIGGQPITAQTANGGVLVALSTTPVLVRANFDEARIWGIEADGAVFETRQVSAGGTFTYLRAEDTTTHLPPNIEGGTPAPGGTVWVRYMKRGARWWTQPYLNFALEQTHLSSLDLSDRRTGAPRTRASIQSFFRNGARARGWIHAGPDNTFGNADDTLIETGETLPQIQDRVLGVGVSGAPLFTAVSGYAAFGVRVGARFGAHSMVVDAENLGDANYRSISWGMDAAGRGITARYTLQF
jgi:hemoglobin/transferrin/lactoferrin receptor protein